MAVGLLFASEIKRESICTIIAIHEMSFITGEQLTLHREHVSCDANVALYLFGETDIPPAAITR